MRKFSAIILRIGIGAVIIWFALQQLAKPSAWTVYLPAFTQSLPISQIGFIYLNVWFELTFGAMMIIGFYTRIVALFLALHMLGIVFTIGFDATGVRDFGLAVALFSISLYGTSCWSVDELFERNRNAELKKYAD